MVRHISPLTVTVPTLVMHASDDKWIRPASHQGLDRYVTDLTFIDVPGGTHWITDEHPELVNQTIRDYLRGLDMADGWPVAAGTPPSRPSGRAGSRGFAVPVSRARRRRLAE